MKFCGRDPELQLLKQLDKRAAHSGVMTVLTGRRRVGKTMLALHHVKGKRFLYLFISRKEEHLLCLEFLEEIKKQFNVPVFGDIRYFKDVFSLLLEIAKKEKFTLILDEFQEFYQVNSSVYSDVQKLWDLNKHAIKLHILFIGSVYSLIHKIFEEEKQPLFGRADRIIQVKAFSLKTVKNILQINKIFNPDNFLDFYVLTGNMPKYIDVFLKEGATDVAGMLNVIFQKDSLFLTEGRNLLIEEFGRDYLMYFSILELIAKGKTSRTEIESLLGKDIGGYLQRLEKDYAVISRHRPISAKIHSRNQKYKIIDNFLNFWFRFIYRYIAAIEIENFSYIKKIVERDYRSYCGPLLERFFQKLLAETGRFNEIGSYWERDNQNEIDLVAVNEMEKRILFAEIKMNKKKINLDVLTEHAKSLLKDYADYQTQFLALSIEDMLNIEQLLE